MTKWKVLVVVNAGLLLFALFEMWRAIGHFQEAVRICVGKQ